MVTKPKDLSRDQLAKKLKSLITVPKAAIVFSVDGVPMHLFLLDNPEEVLGIASDATFKDIYRPLLDAGSGYVRCSVHLVKDDEEPGMPTYFSPLAPGIVVWTLGKRPEDIASMTPPKPKEPKAAKPAAPKVTAAKPKATAKKTTPAGKSAAKKKLTAVKKKQAASK